MNDFEASQRDDNDGEEFPIHNLGDGPATEVPPQTAKEWIKALGDVLSNAGVLPEPEHEAAKVSEINAEKALELATHSTASASTAVALGDLQMASILQEQARTWMELHDRLLAKEASDLLNSAFALDGMTNRDLISEVHHRADERDHSQLRSHTLNVLKYVNPDQLDFAPR